MSEYYYEIIRHGRLSFRKEYIYFSPNKEGKLKVSEDHGCGGSRLEEGEREELGRILEKIFKSKNKRTD